MREETLRNLKRLDGRLGKAILRLGYGGEGNVWLQEYEKDGETTKVAVKTASRSDSNWKK